MKFGKYMGGSLQMSRNGQWYSYEIENQWLSFDALKVVHKVTPVTKGERYSVTLYTPGKLDCLTAQDWDNLAKAGFPNLPIRTSASKDAKAHHTITL